MILVSKNINYMYMRILAGVPSERGRQVQKCKLGTWVLRT